MVEGDGEGDAPEGEWFRDKVEIEFLVERKLTKNILGVNYVFFFRSLFFSFFFCGALCERIWGLAGL